MAWYSDNFLQRRAITVINAGAANPMDADIVIPEDDDGFWGTIDSSGNELRITAADGYTLVTYDIDDGAGGAFDQANRAGRIRIDGASVTGTADEADLFWLYFDTVTTAGDGSSAVTIASAQTGYIDQASPGDEVAQVTTGRVDATRPTVAFAKDTGETHNVWLDLTDVLNERATPYAGRRLHEEVGQAVYEVDDDTGTPVGSMDAPASVRFVEFITLGQRRRFYARMPVTAGTDGEKYTLKATLTTYRPSNTAARTLVASVGFGVRDLLET